MQHNHSDSVLSPANLPILEERFKQYTRNPETLPENWRRFFDTLDEAESQLFEAEIDDDEPPVTATTELHMRMIGLMQSYRRHGHFSAHTNPLDPNGTDRDPLLTAEKNFSQEELTEKVSLFFAGQKTTASIGEFIERMKRAYCGPIGSEFYYIREDERRRWLIEKIESKEHDARLSKKIKAMIYEKLYHAESFEKFLATRYPGKKRFSLEGGESLIPTLASVVENSSSYGIQQIVIGMAHRGRLNVLTNILGKDPAAIFAEFDEKVTTEERMGDVKYHMGFSNDIKCITGGTVHLSLGFNPSHLEVINPVILGSTRARQTHYNDTTRTRHLPVLIHGDAAFAGQGINYECLNMADLEGYTVGGTLHIIVNNQIGFTTDPKDARSTSYCTDLAKMLQAPIFHVNGDDPEACFKAIQLCLQWRQRFQTDVFLDLICYRRHGHNETDEPSFTQPTMYQVIKKLPTTTALYAKRLQEEGFSEEELSEIRKRRDRKLETAYERLQKHNLQIEREALNAQWEGIRRESAEDPDTGVPIGDLQEIGRILATPPADFTPNRKIQRLLEARKKAVEGPESLLDWGAAELLAYGSILREGRHIRLTGQDCQRGTFSHRHAVLFDANDGHPWMGLREVAGGRARIEVINSLLSEMGALGFEFGYSLADPHTLVIWEAQFGDFVNNAQVIIDQFITSCEAKWHRMSGLVLLLPHGYEGQGPEHSSARLERFLQLCSRNNIQVAVPTTPAQNFHLLRRQILRKVRKPLVVMSPKSLLRLPAAASRLQELTEGRFREVLDEVRKEEVRPQEVRRLILCSGRIYYDLLAERDKKEAWDIAIVRIEMPYPYPEKSIAEILAKYKAASIVWAQDEPRNQGAWIYMENHLIYQMSEDRSLYYVGREASPSSATGYMKVHLEELQAILDEAFGPDEGLKHKSRLS